MQRIIVTLFCFLIVLSSAYACMTAKPNSALVLEQVPEVDLTGPVYDMPAPPITFNSVLSGVVSAVTYVTHHTLRIAADVPHYACKTPRLALGSYHHATTVANNGAQQAKQAATQGMNGFSTVTSILLRIAYSSFSALVSGILRS